MTVLRCSVATVEEYEQELDRLRAALERIRQGCWEPGLDYGQIHDIARDALKREWEGA